MALTDITRAQIEMLDLVPDSPLIAVDADEVLVYFMRHFRDFSAEKSWRLNPEAGRLDQALTHIEDGSIADMATGLGLIDAFFQAEVHNQIAIDWAASSLKEASLSAQIVVLTNLPHAARDGRIANLGGHGIPYPVVTNTGGKGFALAELAARVDGPVLFIDDSAAQIESAAKEAPQVRRMQLIGCDYAAPALPRTDAAETLALDWGDGQRWIKRVLG